ncbi:IclR family transcriptional regulator C-terminal domain-containing protein [Kocuria sp. CPCC 205258]|uniref:IclR family transcriptional regulator n=1 Tax=Kocuria sp. CPCC 205258 TaxID=3073552 RepID=UPI0034D3B32E
MSETTASSNDRIVEVLHALVAREQAAGVRELAEELGASRSTVNRILLGLVEQEFALPTSSGAYRVGPRLRVLSAALHDRHPMLARTGAVLDQLAEQSEATVIVAVHDAPRPQAVVIARRRHPGPVAYSLEPGTVLPLHAGATGRAILGRIGMEALGSESLEARTPETVTDRTELARMLEHDRRTGHVISVGQQFPLAAGAAAAFSCLGLTGSVSITKPRYLADDADLDRFGPLAQAAARTIEDQCPTPPVPVDLPSEAIHPAGGTALERMTRLLAVLVAEPAGVRPGQSLARAIGANIATTHRLVATATSTGLALTDGTTLHPGPRLLHWAARLGPTRDIGALTGHILREVAETTGETIGLAQLDPVTGAAEMTTVINGVQPLHYGLASGVTIPLHAGAAGKAILAHCPPEALAQLELEPLTDRTPVDRHALLEDLRAIRDRGWATADGERIPDAYGLSAPYFIDGAVAGSITATVARFRVPQLDLDALARTMQDAAHRITRLLTVTPMPTV